MNVLVVQVSKVSRNRNYKMFFFQNFFFLCFCVVPRLQFPIENFILREEVRPSHNLSLKRATSVILYIIIVLGCSAAAAAVTVSDIKHSAACLLQALFCS